MRGTTGGHGVSGRGERDHVVRGTTEGMASVVVGTRGHGVSGRGTRGHGVNGRIIGRLVCQSIRRSQPDTP